MAHLRGMGWTLLGCRNFKQIVGSKPSPSYLRFLGGALVFVDGAAEPSGHIKRNFNTWAVIQDI